MRHAFTITSGVALVLVAYVYPFVAILRGGPVLKTIGRSYGLVVLINFCLCLLVPGVVSLFNRPLSREMWGSWVPEGPGVVLVVFVAWVPALQAALIALLVRSLFQSPRHEPLDSPEKKSET